jgi:hypothetical protein
MMNNLQYYIIALFIFAQFSATVCAQDKSNKNFEHEVEFGGGVHTRGFTIGINYLMIKSETMSWLAQMEFSELKNPKERRLSNESIAIGGGRRSFIYGKRNNFYTLRAGAGQRLYISEKTNKSIVAVAFAYSGGLSMGMLKPYYLDLIYRLDNAGISIRSEAYNENNRYKFLDPVDIDGASGFSTGWDDLSIAPGLYAKGSLIFDWGPKDEISKILEIGLAADVYFKKIDIMIDQPNSPIFLNLYMNIYFGKRW